MCATFKMHLRLQPLDVEIGEASFPLTRRRPLQIRPQQTVYSHPDGALERSSLV